MVEDGRVRGVVTQMGEEYQARTVVVSTGHSCAVSSILASKTSRPAAPENFRPMGCQRITTVWASHWGG